MDKVIFGLVCGLAFGILDVLIMIPLKFENRRKRTEAMAGAFIERFMLGLIIPNMGWKLNPVAAGALLGIGFSLPASIITRAYAPIIAIGLTGGGIIGWLTTLFTG
jgi:hypothetical protein